MLAELSLSLECGVGGLSWTGGGVALLFKASLLICLIAAVAWYAF